MHGTLNQSLQHKGMFCKAIVLARLRCTHNIVPPQVAAIAIPKVYSLNEEERDALVGVIENLMGDNNTIVLGAAMFAFSEVCVENCGRLWRGG